MGTIKLPFEIVREIYPRLGETPIKEGEELYGVSSHIPPTKINIKPGQNFWDCVDAYFYDIYIVVGNGEIKTFSHP